MFTYLKTWFITKVPKSEKGQDLAEYALLIGLIALVVFLAVQALGLNINSIFQTISTNIQSWRIGT